MKDQVPTTARFLLSDDVRREAHGKFSIIGLYPNDTVICYVVDPKKLPKGTLAIVTQLAFTCMINGGVGRFPIRITLTGPSKQTIKENDLGSAEFSLEDGAVIIIQMPQFAVREYGRYEFKIVIGTKAFTYSFLIKEGDMPPNVGAAATAEGDTGVKKSASAKKARLKK